jgi:SAM-dependent methyltransferase
LSDVPSRIDFRSADDAAEWAATALARRPWRPDFFEAFAVALAPLRAKRPRILELGSGPGFLAERLLRALPDAAYDALDFPAAMPARAAHRLGAMTSRVRFVERSFRDPSWSEGLGPFEAVVTLQAVHELRHKRHAVALHAQVRDLLAPGGRYLVCDHFVGPGAMDDSELYMTPDEQRAALEAAGFADVRCLLTKGTMVLHEAV